jgi:IclR helix-turn-helix domain
MKTNDEFQERIQREQRLTARLRLATERLEEAQRERIWAVVEAHQSGLSIRQIAAATGLSSSRVHQLLGSDESREIPRRLSQRRDQEAAPSQGHPDLQARLAGEMDALRRCREWLDAWSAGSGSWPCDSRVRG